MRRSLAVRTKVDNLDGDLPATRSIGYLESRNCVLSMVSGSSLSFLQEGFINTILEKSMYSKARLKLKGN